MAQLLKNNPKIIIIEGEPTACWAQINQLRIAYKEYNWLSYYDENDLDLIRAAAEDNSPWCKKNVVFIRQQDAVIIDYLQSVDGDLIVSASPSGVHDARSWLVKQAKEIHRYEYTLNNNYAAVHRIIEHHLGKVSQDALNQISDRVPLVRTKMRNKEGKLVEKQAVDLALFITWLKRIKESSVQHTADIMPFLTECTIWDVMEAHLQSNKIIAADRFSRAGESFSQYMFAVATQYPEYMKAGISDLSWMGMKRNEILATINDRGLESMRNSLAWLMAYLDGASEQTIEKCFLVFQAKI